MATKHQANASNRVERVAVIGAGGQMGKHITEQLLKAGNHTVTAITRPGNTSKLPEPTPLFKIASVDYSGDDDAALLEALRGQDALIITMAIGAPRDTMPKLIRAAAKANVKYIMPNWFGPDSANDSLMQDTLLISMRDSVTSEVEATGVSSYFLLNSCFWYEFSLAGGPDRYGFDLKNRSLIWFDDGVVPINASTWEQCGRALANLLSLKEKPDGPDDTSATLEQFRNKPVYISSFRVNQRDMFDSVKRVTGTTDADWTILHESAETRWKESHPKVLQGDFGAFTKTLYSRVFFPGGGGDFESTVSLHNEILGLPKEDLDECTAKAVRMGENEEIPFHH